MVAIKQNLPPAHPAWPPMGMGSTTTSGIPAVSSDLDGFVRRGWPACRHAGGVSAPQRTYQTNAQVDQISQDLSAKHSARPFGTDPATESNCSIYTYDVMREAAKRDGVTLDQSFQRNWMNAYSSAEFDGRDPKGKGPAHALAKSGLGYEVGVADFTSWDEVSRKLEKGDFVQLQHRVGGHQGVLQSWGKSEHGRPWLEIRGHQSNRESGSVDVNVKRVYLTKRSNDFQAVYDRAVVARYDPAGTKRQPSVSSNELIARHVPIGRAH